MKNIIKYLLTILTPKAKKNAAWLLLIFVPAALLEAIAISSIMPFIDVVTDYQNALAKSPVRDIHEYLGKPDTRPFYLMLGFGGLVILTGANLMGAASVWGMQVYCRNQNYDLSVRLLKKYMSQPYAYFLSRNCSVTSKNILMEAETMIYSVLQPVLDCVSKIAIIAMILMTLVIIDPVITLFVGTIIIAVYFAIYRGVRKSLQNISTNRVSANAARFKAVSEAFNGIKEIKLRNCSEILLDQFRKPSKKYAEQSCRYEIISRTTGYLVETLAFFGIVGIVVFLIFQDRATQEILQRVGLFAFAAYRLLPAAQRVYASLTRVRSNKECAKLIYNELELYDENDATLSTTQQPHAELGELKSGFKLTNINYTYPSATSPLFSGLNFTVRKGETVGIVGKTGCGKTTLADICLGLLQPEKGHIEVDGNKIEWESIAPWQEKLGYVPQHVYLCDDSIAKNIAFAVHDDDIDMNAVRKAAKIAQIDQFIEKELPDGYDTQVGERGARLSGGQIQRLGIARALYHNPEIIFFDEATSALDMSTETEVMESIFELSGDRTLLLIAHRLDTIKRCSRIVIMDQGKIIAEGTYDELIESSSEFRRFTKHIQHKNEPAKS